MAKRHRKKTARRNGIEYERLVQSIYQQILELDGLVNVSVLHNQNIEAKTRARDGGPTFHQIDVCWEFALGGLTYKTIVQAKNLGKRVTKDAILTFKEVLDDIAGQPRGIMITTVGFQEGVQDFAVAHGIELVLLRDRTVVSRHNPIVFSAPRTAVTSGISGVWGERGLANGKGLVIRFDQSAFRDPTLHFRDSDGNTHSIHELVDDALHFALLKDDLSDTVLSTTLGGKGIIMQSADVPPTRLDRFCVGVSIALEDAAPVRTDLSLLFSHILESVLGEYKYVVTSDGKVVKIDDDYMQGLCDFCSCSINRAKCVPYEAKPFIVTFDKSDASNGVPDFEIFRGAWGACDCCAPQVNTRNIHGLAERAVSIRKQLGESVPLEAYTSLFRAFFVAHDAANAVR